jgi:hypothetical protein
MKSVIIASLACSAAAFAPAQVGRSSTAVQGFENEPGVSEYLLLPRHRER